MSTESIELLICDALQDIAEAKDIKPTMSFDALGLDSLSKVGLITDLSKRLKVQINPEQAVDCSSPRELANFVATKIRSRSPELVTIKSSSQHLEQETLIERCQSRDQFFTDLRRTGRFIFEPVFDAVDGVHVTHQGRKLLLLNSYNYLGFNSHPAIREVAKQAIDEFGPGAHGSARFGRNNGSTSQP